MSDEVEEFKKLMTNGDCPAELLQVYESSTSVWRKTLIKQSMANYVWQKTTDTHLKTIDKKLAFIIGTSITVLVAVIAPLIKAYLGL